MDIFVNFQQGSKTDINRDSLNDMPVTMADQAGLYANYYRTIVFGTYNQFIESNINNSGVYGIYIRVV